MKKPDYIFQPDFKNEQQLLCTELDSLFEGDERMAKVFNKDLEYFKRKREQFMVNDMSEKMRTAYRENEFFRQVFESKRRYFELLHEPINYFYNKQPHLFNIEDIHLVD